MRKPTGFCIQCGVSNKTLFCSTRCRKRNERGRTEEFRSCVNCDGIIGPERSLLAKACSEKCRVAYKQSSDSEWRALRVQYARIQRGKRNSASGMFTRQEWLGLLDFYDHRCLACGVTDRLSADHVIPLSRGGSNTIDNIQPLCKPCNSRKATKTIDYRTLVL